MRVSAMVLAAALGATAFTVGSPTAASASVTIHVTTTADDNTVNGNCTLREALQAANTDTAVDACPAGNGADTVLLGAGTYQLSLGELSVNSAVSIIGAGAQTFVDGGGAANGGRAFHVLRNGNLLVSKVTVQHAASAFRNDNALSLTKVNVVNSGTDATNVNTADLASSAIDNRGTVTITHSYFSGNGDTVDHSAAEPVLTNAAGSTFSMSSTTIAAAPPGGSGYGPAVANSGTMALTDSVIDHQGGADGDATVSNHGSFTGLRLTLRYSDGGFVNTGTLALTDASILNAGIGSGIMNSGALTVARSTIANNFSDGAAGGVESSGSAVIVDTTITGNTGWSDGVAFGPCNPDYSGSVVDGGITNCGSMTLRNDTISKNEAFCSGRADPCNGVYSGGFDTLTSATVANTILAGNSSDRWGNGDCLGPIKSLGYNLVQRPKCTLAGTTKGNVIAKDPNLGALANNGGSTATLMPQPGSPAIDMGNPAAPGKSVALCPLLDQRSVARPRDGNGDGKKRCDIGAVER